MQNKLTREQRIAANREVGNQKIGETKDGMSVYGRDMHLQAFRNSLTEILETYDPEGYAEYRKLKYADFEPTLEDRKKAYQFAFDRVMALYTGSMA